MHYCVWGSGLKLLFCFHGYGEQAESFALLEGLLGKDYTIVALDMPFHGKTVWEEGLLFTVDDLEKIIHQITLTFQPVDQLANKVISSPPFRGRGFSLLGYSMGGRIALQLLQKSPAVVERAVMVAPDGLHKNFWYSFATQSFIGNKAFKYFMHRREGSFSFMKMFEKYKLLHPSLIKVVRYYTDDEKERVKLYRRWTTLRKFKPKLPPIRKLIKQHGIPVRFLFGKFDNIILSRRSDIFKDDTQNIQIQVIDAGHRLMQEKYAPIISGLFYQ